MTLAGLYAGWKQWLFEPTSPTPVAIFRIFIGLVVLQDLYMLIPDFSLWFGDNSFIPIDQMMNYWWKNQPYFDLMLLLPAPQEAWRYTFLWVMVALAILVTIGLWTRFSMVALYVCLLSIDNHFELNQNSADTFLRLALMMLCMSSAGDAFSVDNLLRSVKEDWRVVGFGPRLSAPWAQRMIMMQVAFVYVHNVLCKYSGAHWIDGTACYWASRYDEMIRFPMPLFENLFILQVLTYFTLIVELALCTLIWFKETRYWVLLAGLILHFGIEWTTNIPMFEWLFIFSYIVFVEPQDLTKAMDWVKTQLTARFGAPHIVAYDGDCIFCVRTVGLIHRLDILGRFSLVDFRDPQNAEILSGLDRSRAESEMLIKTGDKWLGGFYAFRFICGRAPLLWLLFPLLYIPGVSLIGEPIYSWIAANRYRFLGGRCAGAEVCKAQGGS